MVFEWLFEKRKTQVLNEKIDEFTTLLWSYKSGIINGISTSSDGSYIAIKSGDEKVYFFNKEGKLLWSYKTKRSLETDDWIKVSSDGSYIAIMSHDDERVRFFNREGKLLWKYDKGQVREIAISSNGSYIAISSYDEKVYFFNKEGKLLWSYEAEGYFDRISVSSDGNYIAAGAGADDRKVYFFNREGKLLWSYRTGLIKGISVSSEGNYIVAVSDRVYLFNREGRLLWEYEIELKVYDVSVSSDGSYIMVRSDDIYFFNREGRLLWKYETEWVSNVLASSNDSYTVAWSDDLHFFNREGKLLWKYKIGQNVGRALISSDGLYIVAFIENKKWYDDESYGEAKVYSFNRDGQLLWKYDIGSQPFTISSDGSYITISSYNKVYFFNREGKILWEYEIGSVKDIAMSSDGSYIAIASEKNICFFNREGRLLWKHDRGSKKVAISADGSYTAIASLNENIYIFSKDGQQLKRDKIYNKICHIKSVSVFSNGSCIAIKSKFGGYKNFVFYFFDREGKILWERKISSVKEIMISPDGSYIAAALWDKTEDKKEVYFFDREGKILWKYGISSVKDITISADGSYIAIASKENFCFFNREGKLLWKREMGLLEKISISNDGSRIAMISGNNIFLFTKEGQPLWNYKMITYTSVSTSSDGTYVAIGSNDNKIYIFNKKGKLLWSYKTDGGAKHVCISSDASYIAIVSYENKVYFFKSDITREESLGKLLAIEKPRNVIYDIKSEVVKTNSSTNEVKRDFTAKALKVKREVTPSEFAPTSTALALKYIPEPENPEVFRQSEFFNGFIRLKLSVKNKTQYSITDVALDFDFKENVLRLEKHEPNYPIKNGKIQLGNITPNNDVAIALYLDPLICAKEGTDVNCHVSFKNAFGRPGSVQMETLKITVICPIFDTEQDINIGRLKELVESLPARGRKVFSMYRGMEIEEALALCRGVIQMHDVRHVRTFKTINDKTYETWYYGKTKVERIDLIIKASVSKEIDIIEIFVAAPDQKVLTGLLAELGRNLSQRGETIGKHTMVYNIVIKDSIIQKSNLLSFCNRNEVCGGNVVIVDSLVLKSNIG